MTKAAYLPVEINGKEENLPKVKNMYYYFHYKNEPVLRLVVYCPRTDNMEIYPRAYVEQCDFWLNPVEIPSDTNISECLTPNHVES